LLLGALIFPFLLPLQCLVFLVLLRCQLLLLLVRFLFLS
jgi:hypothetical protein